MSHNGNLDCSQNRSYYLSTDYDLKNLNEVSLPVRHASASACDLRRKIRNYEDSTAGKVSNIQRLWNILPENLMAQRNPDLDSHGAMGSLAGSERKSGSADSIPKQVQISASLETLKPINNGTHSLRLCDNSRCITRRIRPKISLSGLRTITAYRGRVDLLPTLLGSMNISDNEALQTVSGCDDPKIN